jgi:hypothetical protein
VNVGGIDQPIRIEVFGDLRVFGKLGKLVSVKKAAADRTRTQTCQEDR